MPFAHHNRRASRRTVRVDCQVVREHDFKLVGDLALDVSPRGMFVRATREVLTGEDVIVSFKPPRSTHWFDAQAKVARVAHGRRPGDAGLCLGIEFEALDEDSQQHLLSHLRRLSAPDVPRPRRVRSGARTT
ncbi:MAG: PilZ domain-containing protein [Polyangiaceae bacterium]|nr:PilZ domain-containing protein [Polyangiaceae bacterium]